MSNSDNLQRCAEIISRKIGELQPKITIILGSGLGLLADNIEQAVTIDYQDLPGFPQPSIHGHAGKLLAGYLHGIPVICLQGRAHFYEGLKSEAIKTQIRSLKLLGCEKLIITNAAGSLDPKSSTGSLVLINDHINFQGINPLTGPNDDEFGPRFLAMDDAYDDNMREILLEAANSIDIKLPEGVYIGVLGPSFETPAEIRAFKVLGADVVGMSSVNEVIIAHHCGLRVAAISAITNLASGLSSEKLSHQGTLDNAYIAARSLTRLLYTAIEKLHHDT